MGEWLSPPYLRRRETSGATEPERLQNNSFPLFFFLVAIVIIPRSISSCLDLGHRIRSNASLALGTGLAARRGPRPGASPDKTSTTSSLSQLPEVPPVLTAVIPCLVICQTTCQETVQVQLSQLWRCHEPHKIHGSPARPKEGGKTPSFSSFSRRRKINTAKFGPLRSDDILRHSFPAEQLPLGVGLR